MATQETPGVGSIVVAIGALAVSYVLFNTDLYTRAPFAVTAIQSKAVALCFIAMAAFLLIRYFRRRWR